MFCVLFSMSFFLYALLTFMSLAISILSCLSLSFTCLESVWELVYETYFVYVCSFSCVFWSFVFSLSRATLLSVFSRPMHRFRVPHNKPD